MRFITLPFLLAQITFILSFSVQAQSHAREFEYLVDGRSEMIDNSMRDQGYALVKTSKGNNEVYQFWWNEGLGKCVAVCVQNGRIRSVVNTPDNDCGDSSSFAENNYSYTRSAGYSQYTSGDTYNSVSIAFDRGFNDGIRNRSFHNGYYRDNAQKDAYADGYDKGFDTRKKGDHWSGYSGSAYIEYKDIEGWGAIRAYRELQDRGFEQHKKHQQGGTTYRTWYHSRTGQCIKTVSQKERISETLMSTHCNE